MKITLYYAIGHVTSPSVFSATGKYLGSSIRSSLNDSTARIKWDAISGVENPQQRRGSSKVARRRAQQLALMGKEEEIAEEIAEPQKEYIGGPIHFLVPAIPMLHCVHEEVFSHVSANTVHIIIHESADSNVGSKARSSIEALLFSPFARYQAVIYMSNLYSKLLLLFPPNKIS